MKKDISVPLSYDDAGADLAEVLGVRPEESALFSSTLDLMLEREGVPMNDGKVVSLRFMEQLLKLPAESVGRTLVAMAIGFFTILAKRRRAGYSFTDAFALDDAKPKAPPPEDGETFVFTTTYNAKGQNLLECFGVDKAYMDDMLRRFKLIATGGDLRKLTTPGSGEFILPEVMLQVAKEGDERTGSGLMVLAAHGMMRRLRDSFSPADIVRRILEDLVGHSPDGKEGDG